MLLMQRKDMRIITHCTAIERITSVRGHIVQVSVKQDSASIECAVGESETAGRQYKE
jgi:hypothetical protein